MGGILFGGGFSYYFSSKMTKEKLSLWDTDWDKKQYLNDEEDLNDTKVLVLFKEKRGTRYIYLVRHG